MKHNAVTLSPILKHLLPSKMNFEQDYISQPNFLRKEFIIKNFPQTIKSYNNELLKQIVQTPNTTISIRISDMDSLQVKRLVDKQFNNSYAGFFRRKRTDKLEAEGEYDNLTEFYRECQKSSTQGGAVKYVNVFIEVYGESRDELKANVERLTRTCESHGVSIEECKLRQKEGFIGVSPIGWDTQGYLLANNIPSNTFGRLYPFSASSLNDPQGMILGRTIDKGIFCLDIWGRDLYRTNSNIVIIGDSGQGKSYLIKKIIAQQRLRGTVVFCFDSEGEYVDLTERMGGTNINCSIGNFVINPLEVRSFRNADDDEVGADKDLDAFKKGQTPFFQHLSWLSDFYTVLIPSIDALHLAALKIFTQDVYKKFGIDDTTDFSKLTSKDYPIFSDLYEYIHHVLNHREDYGFYQMIGDSIIKNLLLLLHDVYKGSLSPLFNKHTNVVNSDFINFDIQELQAGSQDNMQAVLFNFLAYIWSRIIRKEINILLALDELYLVMNRDNPVVAKYLNSFVRRSRKYEASLLTGTQKLKDCLDEKIAYLTAAIFDTPTYKFLFFPGDVEAKTLKDKLSLTTGEINAIKESKQRNCLCKMGRDKFHMSVGSLPFEAELFGAGGGR